MIGVLLTPLELIYAAGLRAKNAQYDRTEPARLKWPVVSVGNLSVGGAGKTPLVIRLAHLLRKRGFAPDVLSRGYGRASTAAGRVNQAGGVKDFGDEPLLIARSAHVPVFVGASRYAAGMLAELGESDAAGHVHLLDDGFQHRQLARAVDIVVMHPADVRDRLLPVGRLREPLSSLKRAHIVVLRQEDAALESTTAALCAPRVPLLARHAQALCPSRLQADDRLLRNCPAGRIFPRARRRGDPGRGSQKFPRSPSLHASGYGEAGEAWQ